MLTSMTLIREVIFLERDHPIQEIGIQSFIRTLRTSEAQAALLVVTALLDLRVFQIPAAAVLVTREVRMVHLETSLPTAAVGASMAEVDRPVESEAGVDQTRIGNERIEQRLFSSRTLGKHYSPSSTTSRGRPESSA
mmetsp:Transcript_28145/g.110659  ORF Transcript_28145/g.110659 Transcript_28145/m.110659 type:complete len:137 (+) Transcript_28145:950-1360(+)